MDLYRIPADTGVFPNAKTVRHNRGNTAILLLHGWTGWTGRLDRLATVLADEGFTVRLPRLPGHGTNVIDFQASTWRDWLRRAMDEYIDLRDEYDQVGVAGASMGAMLAAILGARFRVPRIALLAPAIKTRNRIIFLAPLLKHLIPTLAADWDPGSDPDPDSRGIGLEYKSKTYVATVGELYRLQRRCRKVLPDLRSDTLVIASTSDEAVPTEVASYIRRRAPNAHIEQIILEQSGHQMVQGVESERVCRAVVDWFLPLR